MEDQQAPVVSSTTHLDVIESITAEQIIQAHKEASAEMLKLVHLASSWIQKAAKCGRLLIDKKAELGHGNFLPWLEDNIKAFCYDTANDYMKACRYLDNCPNLEDNRPLNTTWVRNLRLVAGVLEDKASNENKMEHDKPAFIIRCAFNIDPEQLDEHQRRDAFDQAKPLLRAFEAFGFIEIKA